MKKKKLAIPLYSGNLIIYKVDSLKEVEKKHNLTDTHGCDAITFELRSDSGFPTFYMAFEGTPKPWVVSHEAVHITNMVFKNSYIQLDLDNDEPQAYLLGWIVEQCCKFLNK